jgi:prolyl-tRNA synthetase
VQIAPFEVVVAILDAKRSAQVELATRLYDELRAAGIDAGLDDRKISPGAKFKDLELLGFPLTVVVGRRAEEGVVEFGVRRDGSRVEIPAVESVEHCKTAIAELVALA